MTAREFIKHIKRGIPKELRIDTSLVEDELKIADIARRVKNFEVRRLDFEATVEETRSLLGEEGSQSLPFIVSDIIKKNFRE